MEHEFALENGCDYRNCDGLTATGLGSQPKSQPETKHIEIVASRFSFAPNEITVKKGEQVTITVQSNGRYPRTSD